LDLDKKYRPTILEEVIGQQTIKESIKGLFNENKLPHAFLFTGPSGVGKTTIARIIGNMLNVAEVIEIDGATYTGVDDMRNVAENIKYPSIAGNGKKLLILDECFDKNTKILTINRKSIPIKDIKLGDVVHNLIGYGKVIGKSCNKINLNRLIKITLNGNISIFTTKDHLFLTSKGWIEAQKLLNNKVFLSTKELNDKNYFRYNQTTHKRRDDTLKTNESRIMGTKSKEIFYPDEKKQSWYAFKCNSENETNKRKKWYATCLAWNKRREWKIYKSTDIALQYFKKIWLEYGNTHIFRKKDNKLSHLLQNRFRKPSFKISNRNRWQCSQLENTSIKRQEKRGQIKRIRVENIEIYQPGCNDELFTSIIGHKERSQGFVEFYDLEIDKHPSYYANGILVHNCHMLSRNSWNSWLKTIEEPPEHAYIVLCTTEFEKVIATIKTRCHVYKLQTIEEEDIINLVNIIAEKENINLPKYGSNLIVKESNGSPRQALVYLSQVAYAKDLEEIGNIIGLVNEDNPAFELSKLLVRGGTTAKLTEILTKAKGINPYTVKLSICGYLNSCVLRSKTNDERIKFLAMLEVFNNISCLDSNIGFSEIIVATHKIILNKY